MRGALPCRSSRTTRSGSRRSLPRRAAGMRPADRDRRIERRAGRLHRAGRRRRPARWPCTGSPCGRGTRSCSASSGGPRCSGAPGYPVSAALTFDIFAAPLLAELSGAPPRQRPRTSARLARKLASPLGMDDWVRVRLGSVGGDLVATPLPRGAGVLTSLVRADGLLVVPAGVEGHHAGTSVPGRTAARARRDRRHDRRDRLARPGARPGRLRRCAAADPRVTLASSNVGSLGGLVALRDGLCHIAGSHLLDPDSGEYTLPYLDRVFGAAAGDVAVVRLVHR